ncbi:MAG: hypothetical protein QW840_00095 [Candidatus Bathyarchaeia archaeon]
MNVNYKKSLKLVTLLLSAWIISTASAAVYYSMSITGTLSTAVTVCFNQGTDWPTGSTMGTGNTSVTLALKAYPNTTLTYEKAVNVSNTQSTTPSVKLRHISITNNSAAVGNFTFLNIVLVDNAGVQKGYLNYTVSGNYFISSESTNYEQMDANEEWTIRIETKAEADATAGIDVTLQIAVDVQE